MNSTKDSILEEVKAHRLGKEINYPFLSDYPKREKTLLEEFKENLLLAAGRWYAIENEQEALDVLSQLHPEAKICSATREIKGTIELDKITDPHEWCQVEVGIIRAQFGVLETGMVWLTEDDLEINALGFLSQHLVLLLDPQQLVRDLYEAYTRINLETHPYGCFIGGPTATTDIESYRVRSAQGARSLTVFFKTQHGGT